MKLYNCLVISKLLLLYDLIPYKLILQLLFSTSFCPLKQQALLPDIIYKSQSVAQIDLL